MTVAIRARATVNYGHYLADMFPRAYIALKLFQNRPLNFLIHRANARMIKVAYDSLELLGISHDRVITTGNEPARFHELVAVDGLTKHGSYMSPFVIEALEALAAPVEVNARKRLFVSRGNRWVRPLLNETEVSAVLAQHGYETVDPGEMSLREQIALFKGAERVVGALGAAMTNIVFCRPGTKVMLLAPCAFPDTFFWFLAMHKQHDYTEIRCEQESVRQHDQSWNAGYWIRRADIGCLLAE